jgi:hypothetical protein
MSLKFLISINEYELYTKSTCNKAKLEEGGGFNDWSENSINNECDDNYINLEDINAITDESLPFLVGGNYLSVVDFGSNYIQISKFPPIALPYNVNISVNSEIDLDGKFMSDFIPPSKEILDKIFFK